MGIQNNSGLSLEQGRILDLEKKYFDLIFGIFNTRDFEVDLVAMEDEIKNRYNEYANVWNLKNKLKIPAERIVTHYMYKHDHLKNDIVGIYSSPISSDIGLKMNDAILCIDIKTNDTIGNIGDYNKIIAERNQMSFINTSYVNVTTNENLHTYDEDLPVLTYIVKLGYVDDGNSFSLKTDDPSYPPIQVACVPNGELGSLFGHNIVDGFKTYHYEEEESTIEYFETKEQANEYLEDNYTLIPGLDKAIYLDSTTGNKYVATSKRKTPCVKRLLSGNTARINKEAITNRLNSTGDSWEGYKVINW